MTTFGQIKPGKDCKKQAISSLANHNMLMIPYLILSSSLLTLSHSASQANLSSTSHYPFKDKKTKVDLNNRLDVSFQRGTATMRFTGDAGRCA